MGKKGITDKAIFFMFTVFIIAVSVIYYLVKNDHKTLSITDIYVPGHHLGLVTHKTDKAADQELLAEGAFKIDLELYDVRLVDMRIYIIVPNHYIGILVNKNGEEVDQKVLNTGVYPINPKSYDLKLIDTRKQKLK